MSQQTQPQQKQPESLRRGVTTGSTNILSRSTAQNTVTNTTRLNNDGNEFDFYELHYETKKNDKG